MINYIKKYSNSKIFRSFLLASGGTVFAQALNMLLSPVITRIYTPDEYGVLTLYASFLTILIAFSSFFYESAIPIAEDDDNAINVVALSLSILSGVVMFLFLILFLFAEEILVLFNGGVLKNHYYLIPIGLFLSGVYNILLRWALRKKDFKRIFRSKIIQSIIGNFIKLLLGFRGYGAIGLMLGRIADQGAGSLSFILKILKSERQVIKNIRLKKMIWCAKRYVDFFRFSFPNGIVLNISVQLPVFFLTSLYGNEAAGFYGLAYSIIKLPTTLVGNSIGDVFYAEAAQLSHRNPVKIKHLSLSLLKKLFLLSIIPFILIVIWAPDLFQFVFGEKWRYAGSYAQVLALGVFSSFILNPTSNIYGIFERQKSKFIIDSFRLISMLVLFVIASIFQIDSLKLLFMYSVILTLFNILIFKYSIVIMNEFV